MGKQLTTENFIERSRLVHGNRYDYSLVQYAGIFRKVKIICSEHGIFEQIAGNHIKDKDYSVLSTII